MIKRAITHVFSVPEYTGAMPEELRSQLAAHLPKLAVRKFSESGLLASAALHSLCLGMEEPLVSVSTFAEGRSLEDFIDSFPTPSPARFQRSVHPGAVQQARVASNTPLRTYVPIAGREGVAIVAIRTLLTIAGPSACFLASEECGTWSVGIKAGSDIGFAFALRVEEEGTSNPVLGTIQWTPEFHSGAPLDASLPTLYRAVLSKRSYEAAHPDMGRVQIEWK
jgi:hypothetical protein